MKKIIILVLICCFYLSANSQIIKSIELNNGIYITSIPVVKSTLSPYDPVIYPPSGNITNIDFSSSLYLNFFEHNMIRIYSGLIFNKTGLSNEYYENNNIVAEKHLTPINIISIAGLAELFYPQWLIEPSIRIGPRVDYIFSPSNGIGFTSNINYGLVSVICFKYEVFDSFYLSSEFTYNYFFKDVRLKRSWYEETKLELNKNYAITLGIAYHFD
ncbi:MAG: hypothetical protein NTZ33_01420 [Bacteroidetes bacterium]|nr:hypothetical protein [Bacteroidota bacterium]